MKELAPNDIPAALLSEIRSRIVDYSVGLARLEEADATLLGSGTLVQVGGRRAILTADHVLEVLPRDGSLGVILSQQVAATTLETTSLHYLTVARGDVAEQGPDLGAIVLPPVVPTSIVAKKSFASLRKHKTRMLSTPPEGDDGLWCIGGYQDVLTEDLEPQQGFVESRNFEGLYRLDGSILSPDMEYSIISHFLFRMDLNRGCRTVSVAQAAPASGKLHWRGTTTAN
jgi:hypothetical protein